MDVKKTQLVVSGDVAFVGFNFDQSVVLHSNSTLNMTVILYSLKPAGRSGSF